VKLKIRVILTYELDKGYLYRFYHCNIFTCKICWFICEHLYRNILHFQHL